LNRGSPDCYGNDSGARIVGVVKRRQNDIGEIGASQGNAAKSNNTRVISDSGYGVDDLWRRVGLREPKKLRPDLRSSHLSKTYSGGSDSQSIWIRQQVMKGRNHGWMRGSTTRCIGAYLGIRISFMTMGYVAGGAISAIFKLG
jgi:hypothetical protein